MAERLTAEVSRLERHFIAVQETLGTYASGVQVNADWDRRPLVAGVVSGGPAERTPRNRGRDAFVAPLRQLGGELWAWLGLREEWSADASRGSRRLTFHSSALTFHVGYRGAGSKPQMFRAEWAWTDGGSESDGAGHPHWQIDALESLTGIEAEAEAEAERLSVLGDTNISVAPAIPGRRLTLIEELAGVFSRLHFASAASWWRPKPESHHIHAPACVRDLESWLQATVKYTHEELGRLA